MKLRNFIIYFLSLSLRRLFNFWIFYRHSSTNCRICELIWFFVRFLNFLQNFVENYILIFGHHVNSNLVISQNRLVYFKSVLNIWYHRIIVSIVRCVIVLFHDRLLDENCFGCWPVVRHHVTHSLKSGYIWFLENVYIIEIRGHEILVIGHCRC